MKQLIRNACAVSLAIIVITTSIVNNQTAWSDSSDPANSQLEAWDHFTPYQQSLHDQLLPPSEVAFDEEGAVNFFRSKGTRSSTYLAVGLLCRNQGMDRENAHAVLDVILSQQWNEPGSQRHGVWRTSLAGEKLDENWREFIGIALIMAQEYFGERIDEDLNQRIDLALLLAAEGAAARNVGADYTNIALMSAFLLAHVGYNEQRKDFIEQGREKANAIVSLFDKHGTFTEYNSPTYYGTDLLALGVWRKLGPDDLFRQHGAAMEAAIWRDTAAFYHAGLRNMVGPYSRAYGMDMTQYVALTGICIAIALDGDPSSPVPSDIMNAPKAFEWNYAPLFCLLGAVVPEESQADFHEFTEPRQLRRTVSHLGVERLIEARLENEWMIGAVINLNRRWEQHCQGTIHWRANDAGRIGWLLIHGENGADVTIEDLGSDANGVALRATLPSPDSDFPFKIRVAVPGLRSDVLDDENGVWRLPGIVLHVIPHGLDGAEPEIRPAPSGSPAVNVFDISWPIPADSKPHEIGITIERHESANEMTP